MAGEFAVWGLNFGFKDWGFRDFATTRVRRLRGWVKINGVKLRHMSVYGGAAGDGLRGLGAR